MYLKSPILFISTFIVIQRLAVHAFLIPPSQPAFSSAPIVDRDVHVAAAPAIVQQNVAAHPPLPILEIGYKHIISQIGENMTLAENQSVANDHRHSGISRVVSLSAALAQCGPGTPCIDGSCCNSEGKCGFTPYNCKNTGTTTCISNCGAHANCGVDSLDGAQKCPFNICCSYFGYCGTSDVFCNGAAIHHPNAPDTALPCQKEFGRCEVAKKPLCKVADGSASRGRKVAYWQAGNVQWRNCDKVWPSQIDTTALTHLVFAFASIDPRTFKVVPADPRTDIPLYSQFTALRSTVMKTWIAVGGGGLNDAGAPTIHAWSDMASSAESRAVFISSLIDFMNQYGFQGVDLDWETPVLTYRGGKQADFGNIVLLVREMRSAFGNRYGMSIAIPTDFSGLSQFDLMAMQPYLDFFNFMAYDIHGPWEAARLGAHALAQASIEDIESRIIPLWFDGIEPCKVNLGLPYYGRGYTLSNTSCMDAGCPYTGPSAPGPCTRDEGTMSLKEILGLIKQKHLEPKLISDAFQKQITYDGNQWMGYDDAETLAMKEIWADKNCLGGTVAWSVDFIAGNGNPPPSVASPPHNPGTSPSSLTVSIDGSCGQTTTCLGSKFGSCCSQSGYCGSTSDYCAVANKCQAGFGLCDDNSQVASAISSQTTTPTPSAAPLTVSIDGTCGQGKSCLNSAFGNCCSKWGWCGTSEDHCSLDNGCQYAFGVCGTNNPPPPSSPPPVATLKVSVDGSCGKGAVCLGSKFGECCSQSSFCGSSPDYCGVGCQIAFGRCDEIAVDQGTPVPPPGPKVSVDGSCGNGVSCSGSTFGDCCSINNFCGSSSAYCSINQGCQTQFGTCAKSERLA